MKRSIFIALAALAVAALACSPVAINIPRLETGPTETITIDEPIPTDAKVVDVEVRMGAGELELRGGAERLAEGTIKYNVPEWKPTITNADGKLVIEQGHSDEGGVPEGDVINDWSLKLGDVPMNLTVDAGAYDGALELGGLPLRHLTLNNGAATTEVTFDEANPEEMDSFDVRTGASTVTLTGLANANFDDMSFEGGAGTYTLDFSGELQRDASVKIKAGVSTVTIDIPPGTAAKVVVTGAVSNVATAGDWSVSGSTYETSGSGPTLTITIELGVGSLTLVNK